MEALIIKEWKIKDEIENNEKIKTYAKKFGISEVAIKILQNRKIDSEELIYNYLGTKEEYINPFDFCDMDKATLRVNRAIENNEKICIYGDYDADGITATALMYTYLKSKGVDVHYYIPERSRDGYGLNKNAIDAIKEKNTNLIFTVDNGTVAFDEVLYAKELGIDTVVTDHHKVMESLPEACAVVNPNRIECSGLKFKNFAGVGVAFKFIEAMEHGKQSYESLLKKYSHLVAIGTIGDSIELTGETKQIVKVGIKNMQSIKNAPIRTILESFGAPNPVDSSFIAFNLVPRINACGRMENAEVALKLLISEDVAASRTLCDKLNELNTMRKNIENEIFGLVEDLLNKEPWRKNEKIIIAEGKDWNHGVLGIVAARIMQKYGKPAIIITIEGEFARGSCRSLEGFSVYEILNSCSEYLCRFGGHTLAAGFNIRTDDIKNFSKMVYDVSKICDVPGLTVDIDLKLEPHNLSVSLVDDLKILEPFGNGNREPIFAFFNVKLKKIYVLGQGRHLKLIFNKDGYDFAVLCFNKSQEEFLYRESEKMDVAVRLSKNTYRGTEEVSAYLVDLKLSGYDLGYVLQQKKAYNEFIEKDVISKDNLKLMNISREDLTLVYRYLSFINNRVSRADIISYRIFKSEKSILKVYAILDIFKELGIIDIYKRGDEVKIRLNTMKNKVDINQSKLFSNIRKKERED